MRCGKERVESRVTPSYACGQHRALLHVSENLLDTECLVAFQDDVHVCCGTKRSEEVHTSLEREMWDHAKIQLHQGKTQLWNRGGVAARELDPSAVVWKGDPSLPPAEQGVKILGIPLGHPECVQNQLQRAGADPFCPGSASCLVVASLLCRPVNHTASLKECLGRVGLAVSATTVSCLLRRLWLPLPPPLATTSVACHSILVATTEQLALWLGCWAAEASHWRVPPREFVARQGPGCRWTFVCRTWIWPVQMRSTTATLRSSPMASLSSRVLSWQWTPRPCQS